MRKIQDEFTNLKVSRQRKYQLRNKKAGRCIICGDNLYSPVSGVHCESHYFYFYHKYHNNKAVNN